MEPQIKIVFLANKICFYIKILVLLFVLMVFGQIPAIAYAKNVIKLARLARVLCKKIVKFVPKVYLKMIRIVLVFVHKIKEQNLLLVLAYNAMMDTIQLEPTFVRV